MSLETPAMSLENAQNVAYDPQAQAAVDSAYDLVVNQGACACCINPLIGSIYATGNELIWRCGHAGCCCQLRYCCPFVFAHSIGILNSCLMCCESKVTEGREKVEGTEDENVKAFACVMGTCVLLIVPVILIECITINLTYYACCIPCCPGAVRVIDATV
jgi:hypothetical protein